MRRSFLCALLALCAGAGEAAGSEYSRRALLPGPVTAGEEPVEVALSSPVARRQEMAQLDIVFSSGTGKYSFSAGGVSSARGAGSLTVTLLGDDGGRYAADMVTGDFYEGGVRARFVTLPPRNAPLRRVLLRGRNVPPVAQVYWLEGREKRSTGVDEDAAHCGEDKCRWNEAMDYCRSRGGRLLTLNELKFLYDDECGGGAACSKAFWSSTEYARFPRKAWYVDFSDGGKVAAEKLRTAFVRCMVPASAAYVPKSRRPRR